ncbi:hypothetical protein ACIPSA_22955 [Streptomyces sp. NPDC086549]|uniref:hypothetical protein n=1 Tax=Streptomyces sp. NPDC086549 TaxID=3365752 RepID=UPI0037F7A990
MTLSLSTYVVPQGGSFTFTATGFTARQSISARLDRSVVPRSVPAPGAHFVLGRYRADADGKVTGTVTVPRRTPIGGYDFSLVGKNPDRSCSAKVTVVRRSSRPGRPNQPRPQGGHGQPVRLDGHAPQHRNDGRGHSDHGVLAATGDKRALALGGAAAALITAGGGTMLAVRRRRSSGQS